MRNKIRNVYRRSYTTVLAAAASIVIVVLIVGTLLYVYQDRVITELSSENESLKTQISELERKISLLNGQLTQKEPQTTDGSALDEKDAEDAIWKTSSSVITALKDKDMKMLSGFVHPDKGVRFSPYSYVETEKDIVLSAEQIKESMESSKIYSWGHYDGTGDPIELKFSDYYNRFVYDRDFASAGYVGFNKTFKSGNTINNAREVYPEAIIVEYHIPSFDARYEGMDWKSLRLVFEEKSGVWYLTGVIHDEWTI
jgi:cell division protein FtsB